MEYKAEHFRVGRCYSQPKRLESLKAKLSGAKAELAKLGEWTTMKQQDLNRGLDDLSDSSRLDATRLVRSHLELWDLERRYLDNDHHKAMLIQDDYLASRGPPARRSRTKALLEHKELQTRRIPNLENEIARIEGDAKRFDAYPKFLNEQAKAGWLLFSVVGLGGSNDLLLTFQRPTNQGDS